MEYRKVGESGLDVSELALGTMQFGWTVDEETAYAIMDLYVESGGNLIDTANVYSNRVPGNPGGVSEQIIGRWIKARGKRHDIVLATKVRGRMRAGANGEGLSRAHILGAIEDSLRRLQADHIDLYQTHWFDDENPVAEAMCAMDDLMRAGEVRYVGRSNHPAWRVVEALWASDKHVTASYVAVHPHYSLVHRQEFEQDMAQVIQAHSLGAFPYSPLGGGFLTGKYRPNASLPDGARAERIRERYFCNRHFALLDRLAEIGRQHGQGIPQTVLAWLLTNPLVTAPIIGATSVDQLRKSLAVAGFRLDQQEVQALNDLSEWQAT
jgi:aryl-alcohol dehydrogenase-like predicted oxidoreductase